MVGAVHKRAGGAGQLEQRAKGRQLATLAEQLLNAGVDDVGQVVAGARGLNVGPGGNAARLAVVADHADIAAHQSREADAVGGVAVAGELARVARQFGCRRDVVDDPPRHVGQTDDAAEVLERLEQDQERQARAGLARPLPREGKLRRLRRERFRLGQGRLCWQARVGGVGNDRHGRAPAGVR